MKTISGSASPPSAYASVTLAGGVYVMHNRASTFLADGTLEWVGGPPLPVSLECAVRIANTRFLLVGGDNRRTVREYDAIMPGGWLPAETWPDLWTARVSPACARLAGKVTVAGAGSVDIIYLDTKAVARGADMLLARRHFHLAALGEEPYIRLLAVGGDSGVSALSQVEWYDDDGGVWEKAVASLRTGRSHSGAVMVTPEMVCTAECSEDNCPEQGKLYTWANMMSSLSMPIQSQMQRGPQED